MLIFEASLHGIDLRDSMPSQAKQVQLTKEQKAMMEMELQKSIARKRRELSPNG